MRWFEIIIAILVIGFFIYAIYPKSLSQHSKRKPVGGQGAGSSIPKEPEEKQE